jgi:competence protein ComEC
MLLEAVAGEWLDLGSGVRLEVLGPPEEPLHGTVDDLNNNSVVLRLAYGDVSFLLTGDLAEEGEAALLRGGANLRSTVLKVGHHGSDGSTTPVFLSAVQPSYAAISVGSENTYGHPSPTTQLRLQDVPVARTDVNGRVHFETDGRSLWADLERADFRRLSLESPVAVPAP